MDERRFTQPSLPCLGHRAGRSSGWLKGSQSRSITQWAGGSGRWHAWRREAAAPLAPPRLHCCAALRHSRRDEAGDGEGVGALALAVPGDHVGGQPARGSRGEMVGAGWGLGRQQSATGGMPPLHAGRRAHSVQVVPLVQGQGHSSWQVGWMLASVHTQYRAVQATAAVTQARAEAQQRPCNGAGSSSTASTGMLHSCHSHAPYTRSKQVQK